MWKKIFLAIGLIVIIVIGIEVFNILKNKENQNIEENNNIIENKTELSSKYITDDCLNEWEDYSLTVQEEMQEANQNLNDENRHYILRAKDDVINVYYINEKDEEVLYRVTDISTKYLADEDVIELENGIDIYGSQELNQLLEDFE